MDSTMNSPYGSGDSDVSSTSSSRSTSPQPEGFSLAPLNSNNSTTASIATQRPPLPPGIAALALRKCIAHELQEIGFDAVEEEAIDYIEGAMFNFFNTMVAYAHELAESARRHQPTILDVVDSCRDMGIGGPGELLQQAQKPQLPTITVRYQRSRRNKNHEPPMLDSDDETPAFPDPDEDPRFVSPPPSPPRSDASGTDHDDDDDDDEDEFEEVVPLGADGRPIPGVKEAQETKKKEKKMKRQQREERRKERERRRKAREFRKKEFGGTFGAEWLPKLPPKHTWKQTPVYPEQPPPPPIPAPVSRTAQAPSKAALAHLSTLRARLNDSQLVASSLRNLIRRTGASARGGPSTMDLEQAMVAAEQEADLVSYESEWYGPKAIGKSGKQFMVGPGNSRKRIVRVIKVGEDEDDEGEKSDEGERGTGSINDGGGGGVAKRRRWLV